MELVLEEILLGQLQESEVMLHCVRRCQWKYQATILLDRYSHEKYLTSHQQMQIKLITQNNTKILTINSITLLSYL